MNAAQRVLLPDQLPILTEIVAAPAPEDASRADEIAAVPDPLSQGELVGRVMRELELQVDLLLETRLREILAPAIARATDQLMRETREDLAALLGEILSRTVVQELSRSRGR